MAPPPENQNLLFPPPLHVNRWKELYAELQNSAPKIPHPWALSMPSNRASIMASALHLHSPLLFFFCVPHLLSAPPKVSFVPAPSFTFYFDYSFDMEHGWRPLFLYKWSVIIVYPSSFYLYLFPFQLSLFMEICSSTGSPPRPKGISPNLMPVVGPSSSTYMEVLHLSAIGEGITKNNHGRGRGVHERKRAGLRVEKWIFLNNQF